jgi:hypothetical protein
MLTSGVAAWIANPVGLSVMRIFPPADNAKKAIEGVFILGRLFMLISPVRILFLSDTFVESGA